MSEEKQETVIVEEQESAAVNYGEKTLAELSELFAALCGSEDRMKRSKEAEAIKSAFYKRLSKEKQEAGLDATVVEPEEAETAEQNEEASGPFAAIEAGFKEIYLKYKQERAEYNKALDAERDANLVKKQQVIEDLKQLIESQDEMKDAFPKFREIQNRWREIGPVPAQNFRDINDTYQLHVEKFYDLVQINRDLRDLDFRKNLEAKEELCAQAEALAENPNVVESFKELQKLHEQWKEYGPVAKEFRESIWERFRAATSVLNKKYQAHFEDQKARQQENLEAKKALCEQVEAIAETAVSGSAEWNALSKKIEQIQQEWRKIGFASKKENQKIYDRFRAACDKFYADKRDFYGKVKDEMNDNLARKTALIEQAEALKESKEWKKTSDMLINLQKQWKEIGPVPRKKSDQLWKRFRAACDAFFDARDKEAPRGGDSFAANLAAKRALIAEIEAYTLSGDAAADQAAARDFAAKWGEIGFVPFKEKEAVNKAYSEAMNSKFPRTGRGTGSQARPARAPRSEKDILVQKYNQLQQDVATYENNIGFFANSKSSESMIKMMQERIEAAKLELKELENKIREIENG